MNARVGDAVAASFAARDAMDAREEEPLQLPLRSGGGFIILDFSETFVSAFEVSNKVIEMLMLRAVSTCVASRGGRDEGGRRASSARRRVIFSPFDSNARARAATA